MMRPLLSSQSRNTIRTMSLLLPDSRSLAAFSISDPQNWPSSFRQADLAKEGLVFWIVPKRVAVAVEVEIRTEKE